MARPLRILCFGDSLTAGYSQNGALYTPYHESLSRRLTAIFPGLELAIDVDGKDGGMTNNYRTRLLAQYRKAGSYDWVIVLGGTNDIACGVQPEVIFENLERTWALARLKKAKVLTLTVPDIATTKFVKATRRRERLNALISGYTASDVHAFDYQAAFAYAGMSEDDQNRFWDDTVHLTPAGYDRMGELIANALAAILRKEDDGAVGTQATTLSTVRPRKRRKMFKDDELSFDEEDGAGDGRQAAAATSGDELRRGYVVVRRKDLD